MTQESNNNTFIDYTMTDYVPATVAPHHHQQFVSSMDDIKTHQHHQTFMYQGNYSILLNIRHSR